MSKVNDCDDISTIETSLAAISICIKKSAKFGLENEVVWSALLYMKDHPEASVSDAINAGYSEWVKQEKSYG